MKNSTTAAVLLVAGALFTPGTAAQDTRRAWTIVGADLADGGGGALRRANVRIEGDRIVASGDVKPQPGDAVINGAGLVVAPGFIDIHNHSSGELANDPAAASRLGRRQVRRRGREKS